MTRKGSGSGRVSPSSDTWPSLMASSRVGWVRGVVRLIPFGQDQVGEDRAGAEIENGVVGVPHGDAQDVGRQQVRGHLDAGELEVQRAGHGQGEGGFADFGYAFDEHVAAGE